jgi:hypothetical protein
MAGIGIIPWTYARPERGLRDRPRVLFCYDTWQVDLAFSWPWIPYLPLLVNSSRGLSRSRKKWANGILLVYIPLTRRHQRPCGMCYEGSGDMSWAVLPWTKSVAGPMESLIHHPSARVSRSQRVLVKTVHFPMKELRASMHYVAWSTDASIKSYSVRLRILTTRL